MGSKARSERTMTCPSTTDTHEVTHGMEFELVKQEAASGSGATLIGRIVEEMDGDLLGKRDMKMGLKFLHGLQT